MNSAPTESGKSAQQEEEPDLLYFERMLREILHELQLKRMQIEENTEALNDAIMKQYEMKRALDSEHTNLKETYAQLELALQTAKKLEEERVNLIQENSLQQVQLETSVSERDTLRDQFKNLQLENLRLGSKMDELDGQLKCQLACQESCLATQIKLNNTIKDLNKQIQQLEQDQNRLETAVDTVNKLFCPLKVRAEHIYHVQEEEHQKRSSLEKKLFSLEAELGRLRNVKSSNFPSKVVDEAKDYSNEAHILELESRLNTEIEANAQLQTSLEGAFKAQSYYQELEETVSSELKCLKAELIMKQQHIAQMEGENSRLEKEKLLLQDKLRTETRKLKEMEEEKKKPVDTMTRAVQVDICGSEDFNYFDEEQIKYLSHIVSGKQVTSNQPVLEEQNFETPTACDNQANRENTSAEELNKQ